MDDFGLSEYASDLLTANKALADYFEAAVKAGGGEARLVANWVMGELSAALNRRDLAPGDAPVSPAALAGLVKRVADETLSNKIAKQVFEAMWRGEGGADEIIEKQGLKQVTDAGEIERLVDEVIAENPAQAEQCRKAPAEKQDKLRGYFVGAAMKKSAGKANPQQVNQLLAEKTQVPRAKGRARRGRMVCPMGFQGRFTGDSQAVQVPDGRPGRRRLGPRAPAWRTANGSVAEWRRPRATRLHPQVRGR